MNNNLNELERYLYDNTINVILKDFSESEIAEIKEQYHNYIVGIYHDIMTKHSNISLDKLENILLDLELSKWKDKTKKQKQILLLKDEYLDKLGHLSNLALKYANQKLEQKKFAISEEQVKKYITNMEEYAHKVRDFNRNIAFSYLTEGKADFNYALGISDIPSSRI